MAAEKHFPETLQEAMIHFADKEVAFEFMKRVRFPEGKVACPLCKCERVSFLSTRKMWTCLDCRKQFTLRVGTVLEDSPLGYDKWICGFWLIANAKNGISSYEVHRALGLTQKTAWFLLQRIRLALQNGSIMKMSGTVEADESFIGGNADFMHKKVKKAKGVGRGFTNKTIVMGLLERGEKGKSRVKTKVIKNTKKFTLEKEISENVETGTTLNTDAWIAYQSLGPEYIHRFVDHAVEYVKDGIHTNGLENFWCLLKRALKGTYVAVNAEHLFRYLDEQTFRFNERKDNDQGRFLKAIAGMVGKRLTYLALTGGSDGLPSVA